MDQQIDLSHKRPGGENTFTLHGQKTAVIKLQIQNNQTPIQLNSRRRIAIRHSCLAYTIGKAPDTIITNSRSSCPIAPPWAFHAVYRGLQVLMRSNAEYPSGSTRKLHTRVAIMAIYFKPCPAIKKIPYHRRENSQPKLSQCPSTSPSTKKWRAHRNKRCRTRI